MQYHKSQTENLAIVPGPEPEKVVLPLSQHLGAPGEPLVAVGDKVKLGQKLAAADAFVTAPIHASVSGTVTAITMQPHPVHGLGKAIIIENDKQDTVADNIQPYPALEQLSPAAIVSAIKEAGIVGLGGATFPTHVKLSPPPEKAVDTLILNGAECEPFLTADHRVMLEKSQDIIYGIRAMAKVLKVKNILIAIEDNKANAIREMEAATATIAGLGSKVVTLKTKYPQGAEKVLVQAILNRQVPGAGIPLDVGVVVSNVGTVAQIGQTLQTGRPLIERVVTVAGPRVAQPGNYLVRLGTLWKLFFSSSPTRNNANHTKQVKDQPPPQNMVGDDPAYKLIMGGPMMGLAQWTLDIPVIKGTAGIITLPSFTLEEGPCIRCGRCLDACPLDLKPLLDADDTCMECGNCAYVCPAKRQLVQRIKLAKLKRKQQ
jgi:Na+-translocating ferredoxin:NAD+ oxidoreductase subunit C